MSKSKDKKKKQKEKEKEKEKKKQQDKKDSKNKKKEKEESKLLAFINKLMPYILAVLFVLALFTILGNFAFSSVLYGLFSKSASCFIIVLLLFHSLMWYHDVNRKICTRRVCCSIVIVLSVSIIQHLFSIKGSDWVYKATEGVAVNKPDIVELYNLGTTGESGGVIGGGLSSPLLSSIGLGFTIAIVSIVLLFMFLQMFNITPVSIFKKLFGAKIEEKKREKEEAKRRAMLNKKHKKFRVFEDEDDDIAPPAIDPRILQAMNEDARFDDDDATSPTNTTIEQNNDSFQIERQPITSSAPTNQAPQSSPQYRFTPEPVVEVAQQLNENDSTTGEFVLSAPTEDDSTSAQIDNDAEIDFTPIEPSKPVEVITPEPIAEQKPVDEPIDEPNNEDEIAPVIAVPVAPVIEENDDADDEDEEAPEPQKPSIFGGLFKRNKENNEHLNKETPAPIEEQEPTVEQKPTIEPRPVIEPKPVEEPKKEPPKPKKKRKHIFPPIDIFEVRNDTEDEEAVNEELQEKARIIVETLKSFNLSTRIVDISRGPTVTRYELMPEAGVKVRSIANLVDDIALYLAAEGIRMECPIPGKSAVGIEVPNSITSMVYLRSLLEDSKFKQAKSPLTCAVGKSISGENVYVDIAKLVHLLVAGATGQGKSVCINALLVSLLYKSSPDDLRLILIDPKRVEFAPYNGIPHLLVPVVTDVKKSVGTLQWSVSEMERRFQQLEEAGVRDIGEFNDRVERGVIEDEKIPRIVIVIDELYDLKMQVPEIDDYIIRLTQKARAAGIHVIIGTQRPSVDVITGVIKANIPSRIAFRVPAQVDSRTILDEVGAEKLVARGDMLLKPVGALKPLRVQGAFITEEEREMVTNFLKENSSENYDENVINQIESNTAKLQKAEKKPDMDGENGEGGASDLDEKFYAALELAVDMGKISSSYLQRKLNLGFQRAARLIDQMEELGYIGEPNGSKPRDVLITKQDFLELMMRNEEN